MKKMGEETSPLKLWGGIIGISLLITGGIFLITSLMNDGTKIIRNCDDGIDNDGDSWTDLEDPDCLSGTQELWFALSECSDGFDNDRDGLIDKGDGDCENAQDTSEVNHPSNPACSDGVDNDQDSLIDFPNDPGCSSISDNTENSEGRGKDKHNFDFYFGDDTLLIELNWTNSSGDNKRVVWDDATRTGTSAREKYSHTVTNYNLLFGWNITYANGARSTYHHDDITYSFLNQENDLIRIKAEGESLEIVDEIRFYQDTIYFTVTLSNKLSEDIFVEIPIFLGSLMIGNFNESSMKVNYEDAKLIRLDSHAGGRIFPNYSSNGPDFSDYPSTQAFYSPVNGLGDGDKLTIGGQFLMNVYLPSSVGFRELTSFFQSPAIISRIKTDLPALESKSFVLAFKVANGGEWQETLTPYKEWFDFSYGETPQYCPTSPYSFLNVQNTNQFNHYTACNRNSWCNESHPEWRFYPTSLEEMTQAEDITNVMQSLGIEHFGLWATALHSIYLTESGEWLEFNPMIDLIDPNIDAGPNPERIQEFTDLYREHEVGVFWFSRPCAQIYGADIKYKEDGTHKIIKGQPSGGRDVDLRNVNNRDKAIEQMDHFVQRGVEGFYLDAMSCPGDFAFLHYAKKTFKERYGVDLFLIKEGAVDRDSLYWPQMPNLIRFGVEDLNRTSILMDYLVPEGTYYAGKIGPQLEDDELDLIVSRGYQAVPMQLPTSNKLESFGGNWCRWVEKSYENRYDRWLSYGQSIGCPAVEQNPPDCPVLV